MRVQRGADRKHNGGRKTKHDTGAGRAPAGKQKTGKSPVPAPAWKPAVKPLPMALRVSVETEAQLAEALLSPRVALIYLDESIAEDSVLPRLLESIRKAGKQAGLRLRRIQRLTDPGRSSLKNVEENLPYLDAVLVRTLDQAVQLRTLPKDRRPELVFDYTVYGYNQAAADFLCSLGADCLTDPIELNFRELLALRQGSCVPRELLVYGHLPMMVSANCVHRTTTGCDHKDSVTAMKDRMQKRLPVRAYCKYCYNEIYNAEPCVLYDLYEECLRLQPCRQRFDFSVENRETVRQILSGAVPPMLTRGHFHHGVD